MKFLAHANDFYETMDTLRSEKRHQNKRRIILNTTSEAARYFSVLLTKEIMEGRDELDLELKVRP